MTTYAATPREVAEQTARRAETQATGHPLACCWCLEPVEPSQPRGAFGCAGCATNPPDVVRAA